jgi:hypothetical protein
MIKPFFHPFPLGVIAVYDWGIEPFHALQKIPTVRTSRCVFRHGLFQNSAGIVMGNPQECPSLGASSGTKPPP